MPNRDIRDFVKLSKWAGERFDLVQAGGGNSSVKLDSGEMLIKASGFSLSELSTTRAFSTVNCQGVESILDVPELKALEKKQDREKKAKELLAEYIAKDSPRPSIETFLHSSLKKFTLHVHPIVVNTIVCQKNWRKILCDLFSITDVSPRGFAFVEYDTPGIDLALLLKEVLEDYKEKYHDLPKVVFMKNHGIIVTSTTAREVREKTDEVVIKLESYVGLNLEKYRLCNKVSDFLETITDENYCSYLCEDSVINGYLEKKSELFGLGPICPDDFIFWGGAPFRMNELGDEELFKYKNKFGDLPKVIIYNRRVFFTGLSIKKAKDVEDVFKFHLMAVVDVDSSNIDFITMEEMAYLGGWEAEKFRQNLNS